MDDVRGYLLGPPHGTTPAAVIANKKIEILKLVPLKAIKRLKDRAWVILRNFGYESSSVTLYKLAMNAQMDVHDFSFLNFG